MRPDRGTSLRELINSDSVEFLLEAHDGMSARIVEEAGFKGIWASGLAISAGCGVRDNNELSWTQVVQIVEFMTDATSVPILVDGDTGYGDFNNVRRLVRKLQQVGAAGVCIEDKMFPKSNSFIGGERQPLIAIDEFCGKLRAAKDSARHSDFCVVARVEALITGWGLVEALERAEAYRSTGVDAILIHSKRSDAEEIIAFAREWKQRLPLIIVPTRYYRTPTETFQRERIGLVIWANHLLRGSVSAMQKVARHLSERQSLVDLEEQIAPLHEIFRLQRSDELLAAEQRYRHDRPRPSAIVLRSRSAMHREEEHADRDTDSDAVPDPQLLGCLVESLRSGWLHDVLAVGFDARDCREMSAVQILPTPFTPSDGEEVACLEHAVRSTDNDLIILSKNILFRRYILQDLLQLVGPLAVVVDSTPIDSSVEADIAYCSMPDDHGLYPQEVLLHQLSSERDWQGRVPAGRWIGMLGVRCEGRAWLLEAIGAVGDLRRNQGSISEVINGLISAGKPVQVLYVHGHWLDRTKDRSCRSRSRSWLG